MRRSLASLEWSVTGFMPYAWEWGKPGEAASDPRAEVAAVPAPVPGSVQQALLDGAVIPRWYDGLRSRDSEWVEHRHWLYRAEIPQDWLEPGARARLICYGLDYAGLVRWNGTIVGRFRGTFVPHVFELPAPERSGGPATIEVVFTESPPWLGQLGYTSRMTDWKARFNYGWDWTSRIVQIGIWDDVVFETVPDAAFGEVTCCAELDDAGVGTVDVAWQIERGYGDADGNLGVVASVVDSDGTTVASERASALSESVVCRIPDVDLWWPNGVGPQRCYLLRLELRDGDDSVLDADERAIGFRRIEWRRCEGSPEGALPWICVVNGTPVFLQGVNWTPVRPTFADVPEREVEERLRTYRRMGCTVLRVWGGAVLESERFYEMCNELGLLIWQEFPLSSSGLDNWPPEDPRAIEEMAVIARSYVNRRKHHPCLLMWCGGNELQGGPNGEKRGVGRPIDAAHPMAARLVETVAELDPGRRFVATSPSGPRFGADAAEYGQGLHHDVHGPWSLPGDSFAAAREYWFQDDALFRSEVGAPGASPVEIIAAYSGGLPTMPASADNPLWRRTSWWIEWDDFLRDHEPDSPLAEYVAWSQQRQADALELAAAATKRRFPRVGGFIVWMGHDCFPCTANTAVLDFHGRMKPAAEALSRVFHADPEELAP